MASSVYPVKRLNRSTWILNQAYRVHGSGVDGAGFNAIFGYTYTQ
jgi:hypothetical protein